MYSVCLSFLILSGMAALVYQVTWVRLLGLSMGSTSASVGTVLAAFFLGMSLGSVLARHFVRSRRATLLPYVILEGLIGLAGLALLPVLLNLDAVMAAVPALGEHLAFKFVVAMGLLALPSLCIGATFPVMANVLIRHRDEIGFRFGQLYSLNTLGAVLGAALTGFVFIPALGLDGAIFLAAGCNFAIVLGGLALMRTTSLGRPFAPPAPVPEAPAGAEPAPPPALADWALAVLFVTGFTSIAAEVGYTKYAAIFAGTTIYGFSAILSVFLAGIALGAWLIRPHVDRVARPHLWVAWGLVLLGASVALTRWGLNLLPGLDSLLGGLSLPRGAAELARYGALLALLIVPTTLFGALFPLNLRLYCGGLAGLPRRTGTGYAVNTVGGILGSVLAGFVIIPWLGTDVLLTGTAVLLAVMAVPLLFAVPGAAGRAAPTAAVVGVLVALAVLPPLRFEPMIRAKMGAAQPRQFSYVKEGRTSVVSLSSFDGRTTELANNGLKESLVWSANPNYGAAVGVLLGAIPYLLHEKPESAFQVGFGGGVTTYTLATTDLKSIHVVELEPVVVEAVRRMHGGPVPVLQDPRVRLDIDDARHRLLLEPATYDLVISQPSHPWVAGSANVFTRQFYQLVASRLNPGGIAIQWVNLFRMDPASLASLLGSFFGVFEHGAVFAHRAGDAAVLFFVGSDRPLAFDHARMADRLRLPSLARGQIPALIPEANALLEHYLLSRDEALAFAAGAPDNTDTNILCEVRLARLAPSSGAAQNTFRSVVAHAGYRIAPLLAPPAAPWLYRFGRDFLAEGQYALADRAEAALAELDPAQARWLRYERLADTLRAAEATALYAAHEDWPDPVRARHARLLAEAGRPDEARAALATIGDERLRRLTEARVLFSAGRWAELAGFEARTPAERAWQLLGVYRTDPAAAAAELVALERRYAGLLEIPQLRAVASFQARHPGIPAPDFDAYSLLNTRVQQESHRLADLAREAVAAGEIARARALADRLERVIRPDSALALQVRREIAAAGS